MISKINWAHTLEKSCGFRGRDWGTTPASPSILRTVPQVRAHTLKLGKDLYSSLDVFHNNYLSYVDTGLEVIYKDSDLSVMEKTNLSRVSLISEGPGATSPAFFLQNFRARDIQTRELLLIIIKPDRGPEKKS